MFHSADSSGCSPGMEILRRDLQQTAVQFVQNGARWEPSQFQPRPRYCQLDDGTILSRPFAHADAQELIARELC